MKISRISLGILAIGVAAIALTSMGTTRSRQADEVMQLEQRLTTASMKLNGLHFEDLYEKEKTLAEQTSQELTLLTKLKDSLRKPVDSINATERLFELAGFCDVSITGLDSKGTATSNLGDVACVTLPITIKAEGSCLSLMSFVILLNNDFATGMVHSVLITTSDNITLSDDGMELVTDNISEKMSVGQIQFSIYSYQGE